MSRSYFKIILTLFVISRYLIIIDLVNLYGATKTLHPKSGVFVAPNSWMCLSSTSVAFSVNLCLIVTWKKGEIEISIMLSNLTSLTVFKFTLI